MTVSIKRLLRTERTRILIILTGVSVWMLMLLLVYQQAGIGVFKGSQDMGAISKGFDIRSFSSANNIFANLLGIAFTHPLFLALAGMISIGMAVRSCAGELQSGTLELTLSRPISRRAYLTSYIVFINATLIAIMLVASFSIFAGSPIIGVEGRIESTDLLQTALGGFLLYSAIASVSLLLSVLARSRSTAMMGAITFLVVSYFAEFISRMWSTIEFAGYFSPFHYFHPTETLLGGGVDASQTIALLATIVVANAIAVLRFERRDLV